MKGGCSHEKQHEPKQEGAISEGEEGCRHRAHRSKQGEAHGSTPLTCRDIYLQFYATQDSFYTLTVHW